MKVDSHLVQMLWLLHTITVLLVALMSMELHHLMEALSHLSTDLSSLLFIKLLIMHLLTQIQVWQLTLRALAIHQLNQDRVLPMQLIALLTMPVQALSTKLALLPRVLATALQ
jgi:hypothetical protein